MLERAFWVVGCVAVFAVLAGCLVELRRLRLELRGLRLSVLGTAEGIGRALADVRDGLAALSAQLVAFQRVIGGDSTPAGPIGAPGERGESGARELEPAASPKAEATSAGCVLELYLEEPSRTVRRAPIVEPAEPSPAPLDDVGAAIRSAEMALDLEEDDDPDETALYDRTAVSPGMEAARGRR